MHRSLESIANNVFDLLLVVFIAILLINLGIDGFYIGVRTEVLFYILAGLGLLDISLKTAGKWKDGKNFK